MAVWRIRGAMVWTVLLLAGAAAASALQSDELLLLVNSNVPQSAALAGFYRNARLVPEGRILSIPMPVNEEISFTAYEEQVVPAVRQYLREHHLEKKVRCIVTFYGVPLRIGAHQLTGDEREEMQELRDELASESQKVRLIMERLEQEAKRINPAFQPGAGMDPHHLEQRARAALGQLVQRATGAKDPELRRERVAELEKYLHELGGPAEVLRVFGGDPASGADAEERSQELRKQVSDANERIEELQERRWDPAARLAMRTLVGDVFGRVDLMRVVQAQLDYLDPEATTASFDSELSLLWWNYYPRPRWQLNSMYYQVPAGAAQRPILMTCRLDAPQSGEVRQMILASLKAEREGLQGKVVLDSRSIHLKADQAKPGSYGWYDHSIRSLAEIISTKTKLRLMHEQSPQVLGPDAASDVALYCGWYSVRHYIPSCRFVPGAVGFHVASYELVSLRGTEEQGWCKGLLDDGISATLGAVAEPFLVAFPAADDFFPLLLTGKLPLAEVYWRTTPMTSWQISMIGDPLYTPYRKDPALRVADLPQRLRGIFAAPTTRPVERPDADDANP